MHESEVGPHTIRKAGRKSNECKSDNMVTDRITPPNFTKNCRMQHKRKTAEAVVVPAEHTRLCPTDDRA